MISNVDALSLVDQSLDAMVAVLETLGDELSNRRIDVVGADTPSAILEHCLEEMEYWGGHVIGGRPVEHPHGAEGASSGPVSGLVARTRVARSRLEDDLSGLTPDAPPKSPGAVGGPDGVVVRTQGGALLQLVTALARQRGRMEVSRDVIRAPWARIVTRTGLAPWAGAAVDRCRWILELAFEGRWDEVRGHFDARMLAAAPTGALVAAWEEVTARVGPFVEFGEPDVRVESGHRVVDVPLRFAGGTLDGRVALGPDDSVAGLYFLNPVAS
jgi:hypothetical protein